MFYSAPSLSTLPVELLYEIQLFAVSEHLPHICKRIYQVFKSAPIAYNAQYILGHLGYSAPSATTAIEAYIARVATLSRTLRFPICSVETFDVVTRSLFPENFQPIGDSPAPAPPTRIHLVELPRRLFRPLVPKKSVNPVKETSLSSSLPQWRDREHPLPYLKKLLSNPSYPPFNVNSHDGYALARAVHAKFIPLVEFLLENDASPIHKNGLAVMVAIRQHDLTLVKMMLEQGSGRTESGQRLKGKKRKLRDRMDSSHAMLKEAVKCHAWDIVDYFVKEKTVVPDMQTLHLMAKLRAR
ncbi:hypothetical protein AX16_010121 [Volvariella volvacea WC 439]|nr:hypothetical protein AX16_010121 [Volvariella volvacea WC 439]